MTSVATAFRGYLDLCRISNLPSVWSNVLCACLLSTGGFSWPAFLIPALSTSCLYLAGLCLNDICDREHDRLHRPSRPIPSETVPLPGAVLSVGLMMGGGCALLLQAQHRECLLAAAALVVVIIWYDLHHKDNPYSVLLMAACRFLIFVVTSLSLVARLPSAVILAGGANFAYVVGLSLVARYENSRPAPFDVPVVALMLSGMCVLDGLILALLVGPVWLLPGFGYALLMRLGQRYVRGD